MKRNRPALESVDLPVALFDPLPAASGPPALEDPPPRGSARPGLEELRRVIRRVFGYDELRPLQEEAMRAGLEGRDALVVIATGGGKSLCYQAPALLRRGLTAVVSPLISLMKDQIDGLSANGVPAAMLTSVQDGYEKGKVHGMLAGGDLKLLFVAPERLVLPGFFERLLELGLSALIVDEAHCISHWGHDFRPEYRALGRLVEGRPGLTVQAYTATATPRVREDIARELRLKDPLVLVGSFDRPNLTYRFQPRGRLVEQVRAVIRRHAPGAGIVYCLRRRDVDELAAELARGGVSAVPYHAGLDPAERARNQERFLNEEVQVVVATVAFGMGIDRPDVRFVCHASLPKGVEQFSQESGRAGRDGLPAECVLLYSGADYAAWRSLALSGEGSDAEGALRRLGEMFGFASSAVCRHRFLVEHFGQAYTPRAGSGCGACDVCLGELPVVPGGHVIAQKILSCVVRCRQAYGAGHVADVLRGAETEAIRRAGHAALSTYGLLEQHTAREIRHWIEQLVGQALLCVADGPYPTLFLSRPGVEAMKGEREVTLFAPPRPPREMRVRRKSLAALAAEAGAGAGVDEGLFERLRALRRELAAARGVPPYLIFNDRTLALLAGHKPRSAPELLAIKGIGEKKAADLGPLFLEAIAAHAAEAAGGERATPARGSP